MLAKNNSDNEYYGRDLVTWCDVCNMSAKNNSDSNVCNVCNIEVTNVKSSKYFVEKLIRVVGSN